MLCLTIQYRRGTSSTGSIEIITVGVQSPYLFICVNVSSAVHSISHPPSIRVGGGVSVGWDLHDPLLRHTARLEFVLLKLAVVSLFMMMLHYDSEWCFLAGSDLITIVRHALHAVVVES